MFLGGRSVHVDNGFQFIRVCRRPRRVAWAGAVSHTRLMTLGSTLRRMTLACVLGFSALVPAGAAELLPPASNVVQRVLLRSQEIAKAPPTNRYAYDKKSVVVERDEKDKLLKKTERLFRVSLVSGLPFTRLVKVEGRDLTAKELAKENERENAFRQRVSGTDLKKKARGKEALATRELADQFVFTVVERAIIEGRPTLKVEFKPAAGVPEKSMVDKVMRRVSGALWVDEAEAELARLEAKVKGPVPLGWFGAIGSLNRFEAKVERKRLADGTWVNSRSRFFIDARKLISTTRYEATEESSGFQRE